MRVRVRARVRVVRVRARARVRVEVYHGVESLSAHHLLDVGTEAVGPFLVGAVDGQGKPYGSG